MVDGITAVIQMRVARADMMANDIGSSMGYLAEKCGKDRGFGIEFDKYKIVSVFAGIILYMCLH